MTVDSIPYYGHPLKTGFIDLVKAESMRRICCMINGGVFIFVFFLGNIGKSMAEPMACVDFGDSNICVAQVQPVLDLVSNPALFDLVAGKRKKLFISDDASVYLYGKGGFSQMLGIVEATTPSPDLDRLLKKTTSLYMVPRACFHQHEKFRGRTVCEEPGVDTVLPGSLDRAASSISIPDGLRVFVSNDPFYSAMQRWVSYENMNVDMDSLVLNRQNDSIRKLKVARTRVGCSRWCPIGATDSYAIDAIYGELWEKIQLGSETFQFTFEIGKSQHFPPRWMDPAG